MIWLLFVFLTPLNGCDANPKYAALSTPPTTIAKLLFPRGLAHVAFDNQSHQEDESSPPKNPRRSRIGFSEDQLTRIRKLVQSVEETEVELTESLVEQQSLLDEVYSALDLDLERAQDLQLKILETQKQLLLNHHHLQVELRKIVNKDQFLRLKQRIEWQLKTRRRKRMQELRSPNKSPDEDRGESELNNDERPPHANEEAPLNAETKEKTRLM